jgi:translation initiation factor 1
MKKENPLSPKPEIILENRNGKKVTVIKGLQSYGQFRLSDIARTLKGLCGTGGTVKNGKIEIQGNKVADIEAWFEKQK